MASLLSQGKFISVHRNLSCFISHKSALLCILHDHYIPQKKESSSLISENQINLQLGTLQVYVKRPLSKQIVKPNCQIISVRNQTSHRNLQSRLVQHSCETLRHSTIKDSRQSLISGAQPEGSYRNQSQWHKFGKAQPWYSLLLQKLIRGPIFIPVHQSPKKFNQYVRTTFRTIATLQLAI